MRRIKMMGAWWALLVLLCNYDVAGASDFRVFYKRSVKKNPETIGLERSIRTICKWWQGMEDVYAQDPQAGIRLADHYITKLEMWEEDTTAFWVLGKAVRNLLSDWMERVPQDYAQEHVAIIRGCVIAIYRLDHILEVRNSDLTRSIVGGVGRVFYDKLVVAQHQFSSKTLQSLANLWGAGLVLALHDDE